jgi:hypothetical protein
MDGGLRAAVLVSPPHHLRTAEFLSKRWGPPHNARFNSVDARFNSVDSRFNNLDTLTGKVIEIDNRVTRIEAKLGIS